MTYFLVGQDQVSIVVAFTLRKGTIWGICSVKEYNEVLREQHK
jgi:hypothetical protein